MSAEKEQQAIAVRASVAMTSSGVNLANLDDLYRFAQYVAASPFAPKDFKDPVSIVVAVQYGLELGLSPMQALQNLAVINGKPCTYGDIMLALVRKSGLLENIKEWIVGDGDKAVAHCLVKRIGEDEHEETFSMVEAVTAGLPGRNPTYKTYPKRMLKFRARGFALRDKFGDVLKGLISREEAMDFEPPPPRPVVAIPEGLTTTERVKAKLKAAAVETIEAEAVPSPGESLFADVQSVLDEYDCEETVLKAYKLEALSDATDEQLRQIVAESQDWGK